MRALFKSLALKYVAVAILPLGVLLCQPAVNFTALAWGERVLLRTRPVDPRDFLRGDYVTLDYDISDIPKESLPEKIPSDDEDGENFLSRRVDVYVTLELDGEGVGSVSGASFTRPSEGLYLKGEIFGWQYGHLYHADYGIGVYYVPEGTGRALEDAVREGGVLADVRVFRGHGVMKSLQTQGARPPAPRQGP
jgi:uncharacterized membrane-anchored protein